MNNSKNIELLRNIWTHIPKSLSEQINLPIDEVTKKFLNLLHPGPFFYDLFDTRTATIEYVSPEVFDILGYLSSEIDLSVVMEIMHPDDVPYYLQHEQIAVEFFSRLQPEKRSKYKFSHDIRLRHKDGDYKRILIQVIPLHYFPEGGARTLNVATDITFLKIHGQPRLSFIGMEGEPSFYNVALTKEFRKIQHSFSRRELQILKHLAEGLSSYQIAEMLFISRFTVDTHRKNILAKSRCNTTAELIAKTVREGWL